MKQTESIQFLDNLSVPALAEADAPRLSEAQESARPSSDCNASGAGPLYRSDSCGGQTPFNDTLTAAGRMRQFEEETILAQKCVFALLKARLLRQPQGACLAALEESNNKICLPAVQIIYGLLKSAISDQLVDFDIEDFGAGRCWLNDREIRLEFRYWCPEEGQDTLDITSAEYGPTDGWAKVELTKEQTAAAEAALLPMYVKWLDARTEE